MNKKAKDESNALKNGELSKGDRNKNYPCNFIIKAFDKMHMQSELLKESLFLHSLFYRLIHLTKPSRGRKPYAGLKFCLETIRFCLSQNIDCAINGELG